MERQYKQQLSFGDDSLSEEQNAQIFKSVQLYIKQTKRFTPLAENFTQSTLQFRFTKGMSMLMAGFLICDTRAEAKYLTIEPLLLVTVDSQKAFDVVDHIIMLDTYYENIQNHPLWSLQRSSPHIYIQFYIPCTSK
jgi:hypothetical protein